MADVKRSVNTKFWDDPFVAKLEPDFKYLFLYLLTNPLTNVSGIYELPERRIAFDTGLSPEKITEGFEVFKSFDKVFYEKEYVVLVNFLKNQKLNNNMKASVEKMLPELPDSIIKIIYGNSKLLKAFKGFKSLPKIEIEIESEKESEIEKEKEGFGEERDPAPEFTFFEPENIELPECIDRSTWVQWVRYLDKKNIKLIEDSAMLQIRHLTQWHCKGHDTAEIIETSIMNNWSGLFEPNKGKKKPIGGKGEVTEAQKEFLEC